MATVAATVITPPRRELFWRNRSAHGQDWNSIGLPGGFNIAVAIREAQAGSDTFLLVAMISSSTARSALYELQVGSGGGHTWGENLYRDSANTLLSSQIVGLYRADFASGDPRIFVVAARPSGPRTYTLYYYHPGGTADTADDRLHAVWPLDPEDPEERGVSLLIDVDTIAPGGGNDYVMFADRTGLYCLQDSRATGSGSPFTIIDANTDSTAAGNQQFILRSLVVDDGELPDGAARLVGGVLVHENTIYVSGGSGEIYRYRESGVGGTCNTTGGGLGWKGQCANANDPDCWEKSRYGNSAHRYRDMIWYGQLGSPARGGIVIGIEDNGRVEGGYREIAADTSIPTLGSLSSITDPNANSNYRSTQMSRTTTHSFMVDGDMLFALTYGFGLWRATYSNGIPNWTVDLSR